LFQAAVRRNPSSLNLHVHIRFGVLDLISERLDRLSRTDRRLTVFGANGHGYRTEPVPEADLRELEARIGTALPSEYRELLAQIGAGAGPYYGLWSPGQVWEEFSMWQKDRLEEGYPAVSPARPWPLLEVPAEERPVKGPFPADGMLCIGHQGCTYWSVLATSGPFAGTVWDAACFVDFDGEYAPAWRAPCVLGARREFPPLARPPRFLEWYLGWLERALAELHAGEPATAADDGISRVVGWLRSFRRR
jgi:hypothetical protein